jgi:hypothetical protein
MIMLQGQKVFIRTVTNYFTGRVVAQSEVDPRFLELEDAAWIAETGRFAEALESGEFSEVEPYPEGVLVAIGGIIDISPWPHDLPRSKR